MAPKFSVQSALSEMRTEQQENHASLATKVDDGFKAIAQMAAAHELDDAKQFAALDKRMSYVEGTRRTILWFCGVVVIALVGAAIKHYLGGAGN